MKSTISYDIISSNSRIKNDEPNIEFIVKLPSKNLIIFAETIRNIRDNNE